MKILTSSQIHELDQYTIAHEPIESLQLMERAAKALTRAITERWTTSTTFVTFAGPGNNGGDALAVSRMLAELGYEVSVYLFNIIEITLIVGILIFFNAALWHIKRGILLRIIIK